MADFAAQRQQFAANPKKFIADHMANLHMWEEHEATTQTHMLNNVLKPGRFGGKFGDSQFRRVQNFDLGEDCVKQVLMHNFKAIQDYVTQYHKDPTGLDASSLFHLEFTSTRPDGTKIHDYIGMGYRLTGGTSKRFSGEITGVEAVKTNTAACIIRPTTTHPDGWEITSAFPMVTPRPNELAENTSIKKLDKDFSHQLKKTRTYKEADPIMQAYLDTACSGKPIDPKYRVVYSPKTDKRPPMITIGLDNKNWRTESAYPTILLYANPNPPANATLLLSPAKKLRMGSQQSLEQLKQADPGMAKIYEEIIEKIPEEFRPIETPRLKKPNFASKQPEKLEAKPETRPETKPRHDPHFDSMADEIEQSSDQVLNQIEY